MRIAIFPLLAAVVTAAILPSVHNSINPGTHRAVSNPTQSTIILDDDDGDDYLESLDFNFTLTTYARQDPISVGMRGVTERQSLSLGEKTVFTLQNGLISQAKEYSYNNGPLYLGTEEDDSHACLVSGQSSALQVHVMLPDYGIWALDPGKFPPIFSSVFLVLGTRRFVWLLIDLLAAYGFGYDNEYGKLKGTPIMWTTPDQGNTLILMSAVKWTGSNPDYPDNDGPESNAKVSKMDL